MLPTALNIILYYITLFIFCLIFYLVCNKVPVSSYRIKKKKKTCALSGI